VRIFQDTENVEKGEFKTFMRVKHGDIVGEINKVDGDLLTISFSNEPVAGWNNQNSFKSIRVKAKDCLALDQGLNSSWKINIESFQNFL
jgi:hypothetical protein